MLQTLKGLSTGCRQAQYLPAIIFEAEELLDMRIVESDREYKVKWHGYGRRDATWEPESHLLQYGATQLIAI